MHSASGQCLSIKRREERGERREEGERARIHHGLANKLESESLSVLQLSGALRHTDRSVYSTVILIS